jgi:hypothetical protein
MKRRTIAIAAGVTALAVTGTVLAVRAGPGPNPEAVAAGTEQATNNVTACSAIGGGHGLCNVTVSGDYFDSGLLGNGKYSGKLVIDWSTYAANPNANSEMCANLSGTLTYTSGSSVLKTTMSGAPSFGGSYICESPEVFAPFAFNRDYLFFEQVVSGTGKFKHVTPKPSQLSVFGQEYGELNAAQTAATGTYLDSPNISSNFTIG